MLIILYKLLLLPSAYNPDGWFQTYISKESKFQGPDLYVYYFPLIFTMKYESNKMFTKNPLNSIHFFFYATIISNLFPSWFCDLPASLAQISRLLVLTSYLIKQLYPRVTTNPFLH